MSARDVIAKALNLCDPAGPDYGLADEILEALAAAGYAVVKLPEVTEQVEDGYLTWVADTDDGPVWSECGSWDGRPSIGVENDSDVYTSNLTLHAAKAHAAVLLAAARHADREDQ